MLTVTYTHCLADPTYCDEGKAGGAQLLKLFNMQPSEPIALKDIFPYITLREAVWCLRVCKHSQQKEAQEVNWNFVYICMGIFPEVHDADIDKYIIRRKNGKPYSDAERYRLSMKYTEAAKYHNDLYKIPKIIVSDREPSQLAIDLLQEVMRQAAIHYPTRNVEQELRQLFEGLI